jgi:protein-disulfide isomerase
VTAVRDLRVLVALPAVVALALMLAGGPARAQSSQALTAEQRAELERWWDAQPKIDMPFENGGAKVLIVEFTDLQCPFCRQKYIELKPVLDKYAGRPKDVKFLMRHWPINTACNQVTRTLHPSACDAAAAAVMARRKGTADNLVDWLFLHQAEMSPATIRSAAAEVGKITDFDTQYARALQEVKTDGALGSSLGVSSTPSFFLNGRRLPGGGVAAQLFDALIDLEIKRAK